ncbi:MAG TPA: hypothetical protein VHN14_11095, partial [Kofleriaceae bacterium]|nr:hypothetical protein [Kofleriaceae bacterium]
MSRRLIALAIVAATGVVRAQPAAPVPDPGSPEPASDPGSPALWPAIEPTTPSPTPAPASVPAPAPPGDEIGDQGISAELGLATGGRVTPGGLRVAGHYFYQLAERDWFDGTASFTFGSGRGACFRDREDVLVCDHGLAEGAGVELSASVRRLFAPQGAFRPFARAGVGLGLARFAGDDVSGGTVVLHGGGGVRVGVAPSIAVVTWGELALGFGRFGRGLGLEPQLGLAVMAGV